MAHQVKNTMRKPVSTMRIKAVTTMVRTKAVTTMMRTRAVITMRTKAVATMVRTKVKVSRVTIQKIQNTIRKKIHTARNPRMMITEKIALVSSRKTIDKTATTRTATAVANKIKTEMTTETTRGMTIRMVNTLPLGQSS